ncbi:MAG: hypothetical protein AAFU66_10525, partial [Pseudomonadota bacterium]
GDRHRRLRAARWVGRHAYVFLIANQGVIDALCTRLAAGVAAVPGKLRSIAHELAANQPSPNVLRANLVFST